MKIKVTLKQNHIVTNPTTNRKWHFGYIIGFVTPSDDICHAVVQTERGEFETICISSLKTAPIAPVFSDVEATY